MLPARNQVGLHRRRRSPAPHLPPHPQRHRTCPLDVCRRAFRPENSTRCLRRRQSMIPAALPRNAAIALLRFAIWIAPHDTLEWGSGMLSELNHVEGNWSALIWSIGGAGVLAKHAIVALILPGRHRHLHRGFSPFFPGPGLPPSLSGIARAMAYRFSREAELRLSEPRSRIGRSRAKSQAKSRFGSARLYRGSLPECHPKAAPRRRSSATRSDSHLALCGWWHGVSIAFRDRSPSLLAQTMGSTECASSSNGRSENWRHRHV